MRINRHQLQHLIREVIKEETLSSRDEDISIYSDMFKDKFGFRPRHMHSALQNMTDDEIKRAFEELENTEGPYDDASRVPGEWEGTTGPEQEVFVDDHSAENEDPWDRVPKQTGMRPKFPTGSWKSTQTIRHPRMARGDVLAMHAGRGFKTHR